MTSHESMYGQPSARTAKRAIASFDELMRELPLSLAVLTVGRLALVPLMIVSVGGESTLLLTLSLALFIVADLYDGVVARRLDADDPARRILDSIVDRVAVWSVYGAVVAVGLLPLPLFAALVARDLYCAYQCHRIISSRNVVIRADWLYRGLNLLLAAWVVAAPYLEPEVALGVFAAVLGVALLVAADLTRSVGLVLKLPASVSSQVISAKPLRQMRRSQSFEFASLGQSS